MSAEDKESLYGKVKKISDDLTDAGVRVETDLREGYSPGWKFNDWELKGTPVRLEFGPGESKGHFVTASRRDLPKEESKSQIAISELNTAIPALLETIQKDLFARAD